MKILVVGAGLIGCERILAVQKLSEVDSSVSLMGAYDPDSDKLTVVGKKFQVPTIYDFDTALKMGPDWVFICTPHDVVIPIVRQAFGIGSHVLIEKPLGRSLKESQEIADSKPDNCNLYVGFNYRFFAGVEALLQDCRAKKFGKLISVTLTLAHGNAPGMEKSWKLDPVKCGGGCLIDPGVHLLDVINQLSTGTVHLDSIKSWSGFWNTGIEEEAHLLLHDDNGTIFNAQISLNRWKSTFKLEVNGTEGYGIVEGRGRSYGPQSYRTGVRWGWLSGKSQVESEIVVVDKDNCENSFLKETIMVLSETIHYPMPCNHSEALSVMKLLDKCQQQITNTGVF